MGLLDAPAMPLTQLGFDALDAKKTALLRTFYARLAMRDTLAVDWVAIGDSTTEGARQTNAQTRWIGRTLKQLRARLGQTPTGGFGYLPAWYSTGDQQTPSPSKFWSAGSETSGSSAVRGNYGLGRRCLALSGASSQKCVLTLTPGSAHASTSVDVFYAKTANATTTLDIYVNGVLATSINTVVPSNSISAGNKYRVSGLDPAQTNVIEARCVGASVYFEGWMLYNGDESAGIRLWEAASSGSTSAYHALASVAGKATPNFVFSYDNMAAIQPQLVTVMLGINDFYDGSSVQQQTPAQYTANLTQIVANIRAACTLPPAIVFIIQWERGGAGAAVNPWSAYKVAAYAVAAADGGIAVFDASKRFPPGPQTTVAATNLGLLNSDTIHISDTGGGFLADQFVNWLLPR